jgi:hypothetical protein
MNNSATIKWMLVCVLGISVAGLSPACAQSALGGAKTQQNKIGGAAKPAPVVGGAIKPITPPAPPKPGPVAGLVKPNSPTGTPTPGSTGSAATPVQTSAATKQNPPVTPPNKGKTVVTASVAASSNLKCGSGACTSKGPKP